MVRALQRSRGTGPRATEKNGVHYRRARACPSPSFASSNDRGGLSPALREKTACTTVGRGPVPRHRSRARLCSSGSSEALAHLPSDPELFVIRRSQTTEGGTHIVTMEIAGDRPPRYGKKTACVTVGRGPVPRHRSRARPVVQDRLKLWHICQAILTCL